MVKWTMALPWWKRTRELRHARINKDTTVLTMARGSVPLKKGSFISPVRKTYLPRDLGFSDFDESEYIMADTGMGFGRISLDDVDL